MGMDVNAGQRIVIELISDDEKYDATAHVYDENDNEITSQIPELAFSWYRISYNRRCDAKWNANNQGVSHITIPKNDVNGEWIIQCICNEEGLYGLFEIQDGSIILHRPYEDIDDVFELNTDESDEDFGSLFTNSERYTMDEEYCIHTETISNYLKTEVKIMGMLKDNFVIDRAIECWMRDFATQFVDWSVNQIENFTWNVDVETQDANDAQGNRIMQFERAKSARFNFDVSIPNAKLIAAQFGTEVKEATSTNTILMPHVEEFTWTSGVDVTLNHVPVGVSGAEVPVIYSLNADGSLNEKYVPDSAAGAGKYKVSAATKKITPPTDIEAGSKARAYYDYEADGTAGNQGTMIEANSENHTKTGEFNARFIVHDVCDPNTVQTAYIRADRAKINGTVELSMTTDGKASVEITVNKAYCGDGSLFKVYFD